ncbi:MAG: energy transducer TonB, partial [Sediminibacterium sp.]|nr:energy transducer TonB [Sediminibacterium sp.]
MQNEQLKNADFLDILFEDKNKSYGAYDLRKTYPKRIKRAVLGMILILVFIFLANFVSNSIGNIKDEEILVDDVQLEDVKKNDEPPPPP